MNALLILISLANKLHKILSLVDREDRIGNAIQKILQHMNDPSAQLKEIATLLKSANSRHQLQTLEKLHRIFGKLERHKKRLVDYSVQHLGSFVKNFKIIEDLDYPRLLCLERKLTECSNFLVKSLSRPTTNSQSLRPPRVRLPSSALSTSPDTAPGQPLPSLLRKRQPTTILDPRDFGTPKSEEYWKKRLAKETTQNQL